MQSNEGNGYKKIYRPSSSFSRAFRYVLTGRRGRSTTPILVLVVVSLPRSGRRNSSRRFFVSPRSILSASISSSFAFSFVVIHSEFTIHGIYSTHFSRFNSVHGLKSLYSGGTKEEIDEMGIQILVPRRRYHSFSSLSRAFRYVLTGTARRKSMSKDDPRRSMVTTASFAAMAPRRRRWSRFLSATF